MPHTGKFSQNQEEKSTLLSSDTLPQCDCSQHIPGILFPTGWDTLGDSRDLRVFICRHDSCEVFTSDYAAAQFISVLTGWTIKEMPEADDLPGYRGRPYFEVTLQAVNELIKQFQAMRRA